MKLFFCKKITLVLPCILLFFLWISPVVASVTASVDQTSISIDDTVQLTLRLSGSSDRDPTLSLLKTRFDVLSISKSRQVNILNGKTKSWKEWLLVLSPKKIGAITIPIIKWGKGESKPITITVTAQNTNPATGGKLAPVFIKTSLDHQEVYVQEQILLTIQIFYRVNLYDGSQLSPLAIDTAEIKQLGDTQRSEQIINGIRYGVFELKYAIFPQKSGDLVIPALRFSAIIANESQNNIGFGFNQSGRQIVVRSSAIKVHVKPVPANYSGSVWLPAKKVTLTEVWSHEPDHIQVGSTLTRSIIIKGDGLQSTQLPIIANEDSAYINSYPDKPVLKDKVEQQGIVGMRTIAFAIVPIHGGEVTLPPVKIKWFDVNEGVEKMAELPAKVLQIQSSHSKTTEADHQQAMQSHSANGSHTAQVKVINKMPVLWRWLIAFILLLLVMSMVICYVLWKKMHILKENKHNQSIEHSEKIIVNENRAFQALTQACRHGDKPSIILESVKNWCRIFLNDPTLVGIQECADKIQSKKLAQLCQSLDASVYHHATEIDVVDKILVECAALRKYNKTFKKNAVILPDLY